MKNGDEIARPMYSGQLSPIIERTSGFFDHHFDSISAFSGSTVADSEFVAHQIAKYEREQSFDTSKQPTVYNLRIDKIVIDGANGKSDLEIEKPMKAAVNQIVSDFHKSSETFMTAPSKQKSEKFKKAMSNPKTYVPTVILLIILISLIVALTMTMNSRNKNQNEATTTRFPESTKFIDDSTTLADGTTPFQNTEESTYPEETTTDSPLVTTGHIEPSTTESPQKIKLVKRETWLTNGLNVSGRYKQLMPVSKIIMTATQSDACYDSETCIDFMALRQLHAYPLLDDVRENFLIDSSGVVYEGRGWDKEGQTTSESLTSYNNRAVSISFILSESESAPSLKQQESFCDFVHQSIELGNLDTNYVVFKHSMLLALYGDSEDDSLSVGVCELNWRKPPKIIKRRDWEAPPLKAKDDFVFRRLIREVTLVKGEDGCDSMESCTALVKFYHDYGVEHFGEIEYNFIIANGLIFEGINFDIAGPHDTAGGDELRILCLPDQIETSNEALEELLTYAVDMRKLPSNFKRSDIPPLQSINLH